MNSPHETLPRLDESLKVSPLPYVRPQARLTWRDALRCTLRGLAWFVVLGVALAADLALLDLVSCLIGRMQ
jgi:hypothetical protein